MQKQKAYTLIEIIIVVIILSLIMSAFKSFIPNRDNKQSKFGKECSQYIYQEIQNEISNLKKNKSENLSWTLYQPLFKSIRRTTLNNTIEISTNYNESQNTTWFFVKDSICKSKDINNIENYLIQVGTSWWYITINQWWNFDIQNYDYFQIISCIDTWNQSTCIANSKIIFNKAAQTIEQKFCLDFSWSTCNQWEQ